MKKNMIKLHVGSNFKEFDIPFRNIFRGNTALKKTKLPDLERAVNCWE